MDAILSSTSVSFLICRLFPFSYSRKVFLACSLVCVIDGEYIFLYSTWLVFLCSSKGLNYIHPANDQLSEKLGAALIVKGQCGAETIADYSSKTMEYIPLNIFP